MSDAKVFETIISINGVMSDSVRKAAQDVNRQLSTIDKKTLQTAAKINANITKTAQQASQAAIKAAKAGAAIISGAAVAGAAAFVKGGNDYIRSMNNVSAQTGVTGEELKEFGKIAQDVYKGGKGENFEAITAAMVSIRQASKLTGDELKTATNAAVVLNETFQFDYAESTRAATALMKNFGISSEQAYDIIAKGAQLGANKNDDLLDTLNEYSVHYKALGLDATQFMNSLIAGAEAGSFSIDKVGDAIKEFTIRSKDGSKSSAEGFEAIGLNAETMTAQFAAGGRVAEAAFFQTVEALRKIEDPVKKNAAGVALFGTMFEDLEAGVLDTFASMKNAAIDATGTLREIEKVKYNDVGYALKQVGRSIEVSLIPSAEKAGQAIFAQMPAIQAAIDSVAPSIANLGEMFAAILPGIIDAVGSAAGAVASFGSAIQSNWGIIKPILMTVGGLYAASKAVSLAKDAYEASKAITVLTKAYYAMEVAKAKDMRDTAAIIGLYAKDAAAKAINTAKTWAFVAALQAQNVAGAIRNTITTLWTGISTAASVATTALGAAVAFLTSPIGLAVAAVGGLVAAGVWLYKNWDVVKQKAVELGDFMGEKWQQIKEAITVPIAAVGNFVGGVWDKITEGARNLGESVKGVFTNAFKAIPALLKAPINAAIGLINSAIDAINGIGFTVPDWVPGMGGKSFAVNVPKIPMLAAGGFTNGVSIAGEAGQEAVISFNRLYRDENIGYLAEAAQRLGVSVVDRKGELGLSNYAGLIEGKLSAIGGGLMASQSVSTTYNLGGITFAPTVTVSGGSETKANIVEQLKNYQGDLLDLIEDLLRAKEAGAYGSRGVF